VTHGVPAFSDRSVAGILVNLRVGFQHPRKVAKFNSALPAELRYPGGERRVIEKSSQLSRECRCIAGSKD
jgi:hypothetical protein